LLWLLGVKPKQSTPRKKPNRVRILRYKGMSDAVASKILAALEKRSEKISNWELGDGLTAEVVNLRGKPPYGKFLVRRRLA